MAILHTVAPIAPDSVFDAKLGHDGVIDINGVHPLHVHVLASLPRHHTLDK